MLHQATISCCTSNLNPPIKGASNDHPRGDLGIFCFYGGINGCIFLLWSDPFFIVGDYQHSDHLGEYGAEIWPIR